MWPQGLLWFNAVCPQVHISWCDGGMWVEALKSEAQGEADEGVVLLRGLGLSVPEVSASESCPAR